MSDLITFASEGAALRGRLFRAAGPNRPVVVMAHGFSAVADQLFRHAEAFAAAGFTALVYDHAGFGLSDGFPRQEVDPPKQLRGYRDAVSFVRSLPGVDAGKIALWGSSFSGGHVLNAGALDPRVTCVVSQAPFISGSALLALRDDLAAFEAGLFAEREARSAGAPPTMIPVTAPGDGLAALPGDDAHDYFAGTLSPTWNNEVTLSSFENVRAYEPAWWIKKLAPRPLLMIVAADDTVTPTAHAEAAFARAGGAKKLIRVPGGHFDVYLGAGFDQAVGEMLAFFREHLG
jgi:fermentation-respiration switch protein FrsA (DUF1100 family)